MKLILSWTSCLVNADKRSRRVGVGDECMVRCVVSRTIDGGLRIRHEVSRRRNYIYPRRRIAPADHTRTEELSSSGGGSQEV